MAALDQLERLGTSLLALGARRLAALAAVGLTIFASIGTGSYYASRPELEVLYIGLTSQDVSRIGSALREAGVYFDVNAEGTKVLVRHGETATARMLLAEKGLPTGSGTGYELFDKLGSMSLTSFMQNITRVRALEGEIARTVQAMKDVKAARVHIVLPDPGTFRRIPQPPSASVVIRSDGPGFASAQAIRHLVAAAVPGMTPDQVSVLSTDGTILAAAGDVETAAPGRMLDLEKEVGRNLAGNIRKTLTPFLGLENFEVSVTPRLNLDKRQTNETAFDPESKVERSVRSVKETGSSQNAGNKWSVSVEQNVPTEQPGSKPADVSKKSNERKEELTNFEVNTKTVATVSEGYHIENLAVAVVVNRKRLIVAAGDKASPEAVAEQIKEVERLVTSAAAVDAKRGDKITVAAVDFFQNGQLLEPIAPPSLMDRLFAQGGSFVNAAALLIATVLLIWFGLKPAIRLILENRQPIAQVAAIATARPISVAIGAPETPPAGDEVETDPKLAAALAAARKHTSPQKRLEEVIDANEEQAAAVIKEWIRSSA